MIFLLIGCTSTRERYEKAVDLEGQGRYEDASRYYLKVLEKDSDWPGAKDRLRESGGHVVETSLEHADALAEVGKYEEAVYVLARLDAFRERAAHVGVLLSVPEDYEDFRQDLTAEALVTLIDRGEHAERSGDWQAALNAYEGALQRYEMPPAQRDALIEARARIHVRWSEQDMERGNFRAAYGHATAALDILGPDASLSQPARRLQEDALRIGTRRVVFLPLASERRATGRMPEAFMPHLDEVLLYEYWSRPPLFLVSADPAEVYRELRRFSYERRPASRPEAAEVGRALGADFVVLMDMSAFERKEEIVREQVRRAKMRGRTPVDTSYVEQELDLIYDAAIAYQIIDPRTRAVLHQGAASARVSDRLERAVYYGDVRDLNLSSSARRLFDAETEVRLEARLEEELADKLSAEAARRVYDALLAGIR